MIVREFLVLPPLLCMLWCNLASAQDGSNTLVLLHVLFRHGDRTPNLREVYPKDPYVNYTYPPLGYGQLTEAGKNREFVIGKTLRKYYDDFLGKLAHNEVEAISTNTDRTKLSCQLVLAGIHSLQEEEVLKINKSECHFQKKEKDQILGDPKEFCAGYTELYNEQSTQLTGLEFYNNNKEFYDYIVNNTGWIGNTPSLPSELYYLLNSQDTLGLKLPEWTHSIWPAELRVRAADEYHVHTATTKMKRIATGHFLKKILDNTENVTNSKQGPKTKLFLYSGHDYNVAFFLIILDQFKPHIPPYGSYVSLEVHNIDGIYGFKIYYEDYSTTDKKSPLQLKGCGDFCPIDTFTNLFASYLPVPGDCERF